MTEGLVAGRFRIRGLLGSGGTAAVFAADDEVAGRRVAVKLLHPHLAVDPSTWDAFFEEVRAAQSIVHPGLAEIYDAGVEDGGDPVVWIAMEAVAGVTLADHVGRTGPLSGAEASVLAQAVLDALAAAHAGGVVHRDVTPANIMLDPAALAAGGAALAASVRLLDFGLADVPGRTTVGADALLSAPGGGGVVANVPYASPEHLRGVAVTEASDVYQAGATLFYALTGRAPFAGATEDVVRAHLSAPPPLPSAHRRGLGRGWDRLVTTAMLKDPADRYPDAAAMRRALPPATAPGPATAAPLAVADAAAPGAAATGVTRVYRTAVPEAAGAVAPSAPTGPPSASWRWAAGAAGALAVVAIVALSAAAGSAPSAVPTSAASTAAPAVTATASAAPATTAPAVATVTVPALAGLSLTEATALLVARGLVAGEVTRLDSALAAETVLSSDPTAGAQRATGTAVALRIASGSNTVPAVVGAAQADAVALLAAAGFAATVQQTGAGTPGVVASASPVSGSSAPVGTVVVLTVGRDAPASATPTPAATNTPSATASATP